MDFEFIEDAKPKLVSGSQEGYTGHVDGKLKEAKMNRPRGLAIDDGGNIYVADTNNMAIRKISDEGNYNFNICVCYLKIFKDFSWFVYVKESQPSLLEEDSLMTLI